MTKPFVLLLLQLNLILERRRKGWNKLLWWFIPGAERFAPLISVPWSELCYVISVCLGRLNSWHIWAGGIPDTRASDWKRSTLHSSPTLRYVKESVRFDGPGPISPLNSRCLHLMQLRNLFHLPKSITCSHIPAEMTQYNFLFLLPCSMSSFPYQGSSSTCVPHAHRILRTLSPFFYKTVHWSWSRTNKHHEKSMESLAEPSLPQMSWSKA